MSLSRLRSRFRGMSEPLLGFAIAIALEFEMTQREQSLRPAGTQRQCRPESRCSLVGPELAMQDDCAVEERFRGGRVRSDQAIVGGKPLIELAVRDKAVGVGQLLGESEQLR